MGAIKDFFTKGTLFGVEPDVMAKDIPPATNIGGVRDQFLRNKAKQDKKKKTTKKKKNLFSNVKTTPAGVDTSKSSYQGAAKKGKAGKVAFKIARKQLGAGKTFQYKGKKYTTDYAEEKAKKSKTKKKVDRAKVRKKLGVNSRISAGGSDLYMGLNEGGMASMDDYYKDLLK